jgi:hypothetical protein
MEDDPHISKHFKTLVGTSEGTQQFDSSMFLRVTVIQLWENQGIDFNEPSFHEMYQKIENFFYTDVLTFRCFAPIEKFRMEGERIQLDANFSITRFPAKEKEEILTTSAHFGQQNRGVIFNENMFEAFVEVPKIIGGDVGGDTNPGPHKLAKQKFDAACEALRLFQKGAVGFNYIWVQNVTWMPGAGTVTYGPLSPVFFVGDICTLTSAENGEFQEFWIAYQQAKQAGWTRLDLALRRFDFGYQRSMPEDKLIDYMIAFEALLLRKDERQELEYRLSLRGATLLGSNSVNRKVIFDELKAGYKERSNIVHGGSIKDKVKVAGEEKAFSDFIGSIEDRLRSTIKEFLFRSSRQSETQVLNQIDQSIITWQ